ncbi:Sensor histidine kinase [Rhodovulum sp. P5]|uniref:ATP-binding protein n=1 Tax=Rhodovulum sp. P5 TaxID=1564506 RepID=UPI0009C1F74C|nr:ATP-binding protein [Rhodovulum sp. P5]ARE39228.1 Sensor histidine kinase [Rhodovulum sp. P5]
MSESWIKRMLPRSLYGRAALILVLPVLTLQLVVSIVFIQRHFEDVTRQMTGAIVLELVYLDRLVSAAPDKPAALQQVQAVAEPLNLRVRFDGTPPVGESRRYYDLSGKTVTSTLRKGLPGFSGIDLASNTNMVRIALESRYGPMDISFDRKRVSASNPHQLLVLMVFTGLLMTVIASLFLRNQLRPIKRLARAADAFGKGRSVRYKPSGATEVRAAGQAFLDMRERIERQIEQRTMMLSGISHDLRTPLTRLRLGLSMIDPAEDTAAMLRDLDDMERMIETFLDFARVEALDDLQSVDPADLLDRVAGAVRDGGQRVHVTDCCRGTSAMLCPLAVERALHNLINNALRHGTTVEVGLDITDRHVTFRVEDDGPGIPEDRREEALKPFQRLDTARNQNSGIGVGLGLAIAADIARSHGGALRLGQSARHGGLLAELVLAR